MTRNGYCMEIKRYDKSRMSLNAHSAFSVTVWIVHSDDPFELVSGNAILLQELCYGYSFLLLHLHFTICEISLSILNGTITPCTFCYCRLPKTFQLSRVILSRRHRRGSYFRHFGEKARKRLQVIEKGDIIGEILLEGMGIFEKGV